MNGVISFNEKDIESSTSQENVSQENATIVQIPQNAEADKPMG